MTMNFYYFQGNGVNVSQSPELWYLSLAVMGLITLTAAFVAGAFLLRKWQERNWGWCPDNASLQGKVMN